MYGFKYLIICSTWLNSSIQSTDRTLTGTTNPGQSRPGSNRTLTSTTNPGQSRPGSNRTLTGTTNPGQSRPGSNRTLTSTTNPGQSRPGSNRTLTGTTNPGQSRPGSNNNKKVLHILLTPELESHQFSVVSRISKSCLFSIRLTLSNCLLTKRVGCLFVRKAIWRKCSGQSYRY